MRQLFIQSPKHLQNRADSIDAYSCPCTKLWGRACVEMRYESVIYYLLLCITETFT